MRQSILTELRDKSTTRAGFRAAAMKLSYQLAEETLKFVPEKSVSVATPFGKAAGAELAQKVVLVPILRSGVALLPAFLFYFEDAAVGFVGLKRDEKTAIAYEYYRNLPPIGKNDLVIVLDPMLATGGSSVDTFKILVDSGISEKNIIGVFLIAAPEGVNNIKTHFPKCQFVIGVEDEGLNNKKYIVPGIGDFGDRFFGTES